MKEIKLFDYQEDMKGRIEKALRLHRSVLAQMPTGTGKNGSTRARNRYALRLADQSGLRQVVRAGTAWEREV